MKRRAPSPSVRSSLLALVLALLALPLPSAAQEDRAGWLPLGPRAGRPVGSMAVVPETPGTLLVATRAGLWRAVSGDTWTFEEVEGPFGPASGELYTAQDGTGPVYLVGRGLYRRDEGPSWTVLREDVRGFAFAVAPRRPSQLYHAPGLSPVFEGDAIVPRGLEVSRDGGETWTEGAPFEPGPSVIQVSSSAVAVGHQSPEVVYILLSDLADKGFPAHRRLLRSDDGGATWQVENELPQEVEAGSVMEVAPNDDFTVYLALRSGLYRSTDGGVTVERLPATGLPADRTGSAAQAPEYDVRDLAIDPGDPATLYAAIRHEPFEEVTGGVYRSTDGGATWSRASDGLPPATSVLRVIVDPADPATVYAATPRGVFRSTNGGSHWAVREPRLPTPVAEAAVDPARPSRIYAGTGDHRLFVSDDGGRAWLRIGDELPDPAFDFLPSAIRVVAIAPTDPSTLFVAGNLHTDDGVVLGRSLDRGESFDLLPIPVAGDVEEIVIDPRDPSRVLLSVSRVGGLFESTDRGRTWNRLHDGPVFDLLQAPSDPSVLYIQYRTRIPPTAREFRVCRSEDDGATWSCPPSVFTDRGDLSAIAVDPRDASTLLSMQIVGGPDADEQDAPWQTLVRRSDDGGETWSPPFRPFPEGVRVVDLAIDPRSPETVWAATATDGVFRSADGGDSWLPMSRGLAHPRVDTLVFGPRGRVLFAATPAGLYRFSATGGPAPPAELDWITDATIEGFRIKVRIGQGTAPPIAATKEPVCIPETVCLSGALPGRSEVFVRIVGPKPNGFLWPTLVKLTTSRVEVWIEQLSTAEIRYYELRGASPGFDELPGLFDRDGFLPE